VHACLIGPTPFTMPNGSLTGSAVFAWSMPYSSYIRYTLRRAAAPFLPENCRWGDLYPIYMYHMVPLTHADHPAVPSGISMESAFYREFTVVTNGRTDRRTERTRNSVDKKRPLKPYVIRHRATRSNNTWSRSCWLRIRLRHVNRALRIREEARLLLQTDRARDALVSRILVNRCRNIRDLSGLSTYRFKVQVRR